ncbi:hypothetical protein [Sanguibacter sp. HDW7]|uniref:hypothetical protein n=1 Tax=Sanguibacter sp. HDW7 TaxID=2714931 RepID=UPI0014081A3C|nr:hypothetical protein [Sanguibacter sp. HDW7]QIK82559.1 hypothetical protein G7063_02175 [Sanguibacter sp. HDW7]
MSTLLRPTGSLPPRVYWRRRLVVLVVLVAVVALAVVVVQKIGDGPSTPKDKPAAGATSSPSETPSAGVPICTKDVLATKLEANGSEFAAGAEPAFTVTMTNTSKVPCLVDVSHETRVVTVTSGPARVWGSGDCVKSSKPKTLLVGAGKSEASTLTWDRTRSEEGCPRTGVVAKAGTYKATATVLGAASKEISFVLK